jgi:hypothetical protein
MTTFGSLFAGIGGFDLGVKERWVAASSAALALGARRHMIAAICARRKGA